MMIRAASHAERSLLCLRAVTGGVLRHLYARCNSYCVAFAPALRRPPKRNFWALRVFWPRLDATGGARETSPRPFSKPEPTDPRKPVLRHQVVISRADVCAHKSLAPALLAHCKFSGHATRRCNRSLTQRDASCIALAA